MKLKLDPRHILASLLVSYAPKLIDLAVKKLESKAPKA